MKLNIFICLLVIAGVFCAGIFTGTVWQVDNADPVTANQSIPLPVITLEAHENLLIDDPTIWDNIYLSTDGDMNIYIDGKLYEKSPVTVTEITITPEPEIVTVYEPVQLKEFEGIDILTVFVNQNINTRIIFRQNPTDGDCEIYALAMKGAARLQGYELNFQVSRIHDLPDYVITNLETLLNRKINRNDNHALLSSIIWNDVYLIEPQTGDIWVGGLLK